MSEIAETARTGFLTAYDGIFIAGKAEGRAEGEARGRAEGRAEGEARGKAEGRAEGQRNSLIRYLKKHFELPADVIQKIEGISDIDLLNDLLDAAFDASSLDDVLKALPDPADKA